MQLLNTVFYCESWLASIVYRREVRMAFCFYHLVTKSSIFLTYCTTTVLDNLQYVLEHF